MDPDPQDGQTNIIDLEWYRQISGLIFHHDARPNHHGNKSPDSQIDRN